MCDVRKILSLRAATAYPPDLPTLHPKILNVGERVAFVSHYCSLLGIEQSSLLSKDVHVPKARNLFYKF